MLIATVKPFYSTFLERNLEVPSIIISVIYQLLPWCPVKSFVSYFYAICL